MGLKPALLSSSKEQMVDLVPEPGGLEKGESLPCSPHEATQTAEKQNTVGTENRLWSSGAREGGGRAEHVTRQQEGPARPWA